MKRPPGTARSQSSSGGHHHHALLSTSIATSPRSTGAVLPSSPRKSSALPLPSLKLKHNRSFALLAQMIGIGSMSRSASGTRDPNEADSGEEDEGEDGEEDDGEEDEEAQQDEVDEETLLWDAQSALIAHQPALALEHYTQAALPPHRSSAACLALGHLLTRGSSLAPLSPTSPTSPTTQTDIDALANNKGKSRAYSFASPPTSHIPLPSVGIDSEPTGTLPRIASRIRNFFSPPDVEAVQTPPVPERVYTDLVANNWAIPTVGKRAVRDVEGMGVAGGWYVLGLGWIVDGQHQLPLAKAIRDFEEDEYGAHSRGSTITPDNVRRKLQEERDQEKASEDVLEFGSRRVKLADRKGVVPRMAEPPLATPGAQEDKGSNSSEGTVLKTPPGGQEDLAATAPIRDVETTMKLMFDILTPLTRLYRNGHIQASDPVYLPPIQPSQLPDCLRPQGDLQKRRNVWHLGAAVARYILDMGMLKRLSPVREVEAQRRAVQVMAHYVLGMTASPRQSARHFRIIITLNHSGYTYPDELINQASQRLEILHRSPDVQSPEGAEFPFPHRSSLSMNAGAPAGSESMHATIFVTPRAGARAGAKRIRSSAPIRHGRSDSILSIASSIGSHRTPIKSVGSVASLADLDDEYAGKSADLSTPAPAGMTALGSLKIIKEAAVAEQAERHREQKQREALAERRASHGAMWPNLLSWTYGLPSSPSASALASPASTAPPLSPFATKPGVKNPASVDSVSGSETSPRTVPRQHLRSGSESTDVESHTETLEVPLIRHIASTPTLGTLRVKEFSVRPGTRTGNATPDTFVNDVHAAINLKVDPVLAAAELNSALTKRVQCSVCCAKGVNFPECRRCGLVFCSRPCRVEETGAGNGKKHVCGMWESRKLLAPPEKDKRGKAVPMGSSIRGAPKLTAYMQAPKPGAELGVTPRSSALGSVTAC